mgnify:CR=1 FL=1
MPPAAYGNTAHGRAPYAALNADARAAKVMALEMEIAKRQWTTAQRRDVVALNNVMSPAQLKAYAPGFPWDAFLAEMKFDKQARIKVLTDTAVRDIAKLFADTPVPDMQSFLTFKTLDAWADSLSEPWVQAHFDFHVKRLQDTPERRPAELESIAAVNAASSFGGTRRPVTPSIRASPLSRVVMSGSPQAAASGAALATPAAQRQAPQPAPPALPQEPPQPEWAALPLCLEEA